MEANPRQTLREMTQELHVDPTISSYLIQIGKVKKHDKWVPHELNENQTNPRYEVGSVLLLCNKNEPFLDRIVTCDEKWILYDNLRRSPQWLHYNETPKHFPKAKVASKEG
jgi:histone-lysine N-methyltransferase SETMAR